MKAYFFQDGMIHSDDSGKMMYNDGTDQGSYRFADGDGIILL